MENLTSAEKRLKKYGWNRIQKPRCDGFEYRHSHTADTIVFEQINEKWYVCSCDGWYATTYFNQQMIEAILARIKELNASLREEKQ